MAGESFALSEEKVRPGVYVRVVSSGTGGSAVLPRGIVGAIFRSNWGPVGSVAMLESEGQIAELFGSGTNVLVARQAFRGGARRVAAVRLGTGGTKATKVLNDGAAAPVATVTAKYEGLRGNGFTFTVRTSLVDATKREGILYEGSTELERHTYTAGADEAAAIAAAFAGSAYVDVVKTAVGNGVLATVTQTALATGTEPTTTGSALTTALGILELEEFNVLAVDVEDSTSLATIDAWIATARNNGRRIMAVVGEPVSVAIATRRTNAAALNNEAVVYVGNGFVTADGTFDGFEAAARVAGMIASAPVTGSLTHAVVDGATELVGGMTSLEVEQAIGSGVLVFTRNAARQVQIEYGITTLVTPGPEQDAGWKKIRRVRTRDELISQIVADSDPLIGRVNNDSTGRALLQAKMQGAVNRLIAQGALVSGSVVVDPANAPAGDSAWFVVEVDDNDSVEKLYVTFGFRFAAPAAA